MNDDAAMPSMIGPILLELGLKGTHNILHCVSALLDQYSKSLFLN